MEEENIKLRNEINILKTKILNEIKAFSFHKELKYLCDYLVKEIDDYEYNPNDNLSLKKYYAFLESFFELIITPINNMIININKINPRS